MCVRVCVRVCECVSVRVGVCVKKKNQRKPGPFISPHGMH